VTQLLLGPPNVREIENHTNKIGKK